MDLASFKAISFDCYGTLIDWETGIYESFRPLLNRLPLDHKYRKDPEALAARFNSFQGPMIREHHTMLYNDLVATCYANVAEEEGLRVTDEEKEAFGNSVGNWPAFADTVDGLQRLKKYYKLIILSNVDRKNMANSLANPFKGVGFDAVYIAEDIGSYKPNHANFTYLFDHARSELGIEKNQLLHTAKSLPVDHVPAKELGLTSVWIARGKDGVSGMGGDVKDFEGKVAFKWRFPSIGAMADAVEEAFRNL